MIVARVEIFFKINVCALSSWENKQLSIVLYLLENVFIASPCCSPDA